MADEDRSFQDVVGDIVYGSDDAPDPSDADETEDEVNSTAPDESAPDEESPDEPDRPAGEPESEDEPEEEVDDDDALPEPEATDEPAEEPEGEEVEPDEGDDLEDVDTDDDEEPEETEEFPELPEGFEVKDGKIVVKVDGDEEVDAEELRQSYFRQSDYTQKTQELARRREQLEEAREDTQQLVRDLNSDDEMREFLGEHPEALEYLIQDPEGARQLLRNRQEFEAFKSDYQVLQENPRLAEAYLQSDDEEAARQRLEQERVKQNVVGFVSELERGIQTIAEHEEFSDAIDEDDVARVREYVMDLGGFDENSSQEEILQGVQRLGNIFVTPDGQQLDMQLVIDRFETIKAQKERESDLEDEKVEEHNRQVDAELEEAEERPPSTPESETGPAPEAEKTPERENFREVLGVLRGE